MNDDTRTIWCGNLSEKVTEDLLYELFLQAAPLEAVRIPPDKNGRKSNYGFVVVKHEVSVEYAIQLLDGTFLFDRQITVKPRNGNRKQPPAVVDNINCINKSPQVPFNQRQTPRHNPHFNRMNHKPYNRPNQNKNEQHNPGWRPKRPFY